MPGLFAQTNVKSPPVPGAFADASTSSNPSSRLLEDLVAYWKFDENTGTVADDATGNGNTGTITDATWAVGKINSCLLFDGSNDYVSLGNPVDLAFDQATPFSVAFWAKVSLNNAYRLIGALGVASVYQGWSIVQNGGIEIQLIHNNSTGNYIVGISAGNIHDGNWHHTTCTYDGSSKLAGCKVYIDAVPQPFVGTTDALTGSFASTTPIDIGRDQTVGQYLNGNLDEIGIWKRVLQSSEILTLYNYGNGLQYPFV